MSKLRAAFTLDSVTLRDISNEVGGVSVTNDADAVVEYIYNTIGSCRIFYIDTMGNRDELLHDHGKFKGFAPAREIIWPKGD